MKDRNDDRSTIARRSLLKAGLGGAGASMLASFGGVRWAYAADKPAIGTWPAGSQGNTVYIGAAVPLTGTYALQGEDERKGMELAVEHINTNHELMKKFAPKVNNGLLGKKVALALGRLGRQAEPGAAGGADLHQPEQDHHDDRLDLVGRGGRDEQVRGAREDPLPGRHFRLQRHDRQGLRALRLPAELLRRDRGQRDRPGAGEEFRQEPQGGVHDAGLHLRPHRDEVRQRLPDEERRLDHGDQPGVAARHPGLQPVSDQHRQFRRRIPHQRQLGPRRRAFDASKPSSSACCRR